MASFRDPTGVAALTPIVARRHIGDRIPRTLSPRVRVCPVSALAEDESGQLECDDTCPIRNSAQWLGNRLLTLLWEYTGIPDPDRMAIDPAVVPTHYATRGYGARADIDSEWVADDFKPKAGLNVLQVRKDKRAKQTTQEATKAKKMNEARQPKPSGPHSHSSVNSNCELPESGGAGNRTRVRAGPFCPSTCVATLSLLDPRTSCGTVR
jgi:hypothetical protein